MRLIRGYWKTIIICIGILYASLNHTPGIALPTFVGADKWMHGLMYAVLGCAICWESSAMHVQGWKKWMITLGFPVIFGGFIEILQETWFPPRSGDWMDWVADCAGAIVGWGVVVIFKRIRTCKQNG